jgi:hypothetical protein
LVSLQCTRKKRKRKRKRKRKKEAERLFRKAMAKWPFKIIIKRGKMGKT